MRMIWIVAFGLLVGSGILWLTGNPPPSAIHGVKFYPQMVLSGIVVLIGAVINFFNGRPGKPSRPT